VPWLSAEIVRVRLVVIAAIGYFALTALTVWQAFRAEPIHQPSVAVVVAGVVLLSGVVIASVIAVRAQPPVESESPRELTRVG